MHQFKDVISTDATQDLVVEITIHLTYTNVYLCV